MKRLKNFIRRIRSRYIRDWDNYQTKLVEKWIQDENADTVED